MVDPPMNVLDVELSGCRPEPLASYLKALGVLRLVAEQRDSNARGFWKGEHFVLRSSLDEGALLRFFLEEVVPTPVIAPWNGGSGFYPKDNKEAAEAILASSDPRLASFAEAIRLARAFVSSKGWGERPSDDNKTHLISAMRARLPDEALAWLDAAIVLGDERPLFPPLLGTGGNDGRLDFSNNYQQRVIEVLGAGSDSASPRSWLASALFGTTITTRFKGTMGQYHPSASARTNPWDFVLLIEGALVFAAAATRRYETASRGMLSFPFHARAAGGVSTLADSDEEESRNELWLPLWTRPATFQETRRLFAEGRATVGTGANARPATSALDFARAVSALGVDRGIASFVRIGFHVRNGLAYFATPLGRYATREIPNARLLDDVDAWFEHFRQKTPPKTTPARVAVARRRLEQALFEAAATGSLSAVLLELGETERALSRSLSFANASSIRPVPKLSTGWAHIVMDGSLEQRLAAALAARPGMRRRLVPLDREFFAEQIEASVVFTDRSLIDNLHALLLRDDVEAQQRESGPPYTEHRARCSLTDIAYFIQGDVDDVLVERWLRALVLGGEVSPEVPRDSVLPPAAFAVLALVHNRRLSHEPNPLPRSAEYLSRACAGDADGATAAAIRRLNASGRPLPIRSIATPARVARRVAAALAFPLTSSQRWQLERMVLPHSEKETDRIISQEPA